jgi:hypothetical protein
MLKGCLPLGFVALLALMAGCRSNPPSEGPTHSPAPVAKPTDAWLGRWDGVEGTYLRLSKSGDQYVVEIQDLDGPKTFAGSADGNRVRFTRNGKTEFLSAGDGQATGMKWLTDKKDCLLTRAGEGWCRN